MNTERNPAYYRIAHYHGRCWLCWRRLPQPCALCHGVPGSPVCRFSLLYTKEGYRVAHFHCVEDMMY